MAGEWIKMRGNLWDDPRVGALADACDCGEAAIVGALYWLWATADQHTEDGVMPGLSRRQIDRKTGIAGFGDALVSIGWIADHPEGILIVKFEEHNGASAKRRCMEAQRKANARNVSASDADNTQTDAGQIPPSCGAREEKRREEENTPPTPKGEPDGFTTFWDEWPKSDRKGGRVKCLEAWRKAKCEGEALVILAHVQRLKTSDDWRRENGRFIPAPLVYLNQRRWDGASDGGSSQGGLNLIGAI